VSTVTRGFSVSLLGMRLAVGGDSPAIARVLDRYVLPWLPREAFDAVSADRRVEVRAARDGASLEVLVDGVVTEAAPSLQDVVTRVQRALDDAVVQHQRRVAIVHAGVVAHEGRALLLPGPSRAGKSTLVAELLRRGALYLSDEYALIDPEGRAHPYPRPLLLRGEAGDDALRLATELDSTALQEPIPVGLILGVTYSTDAAIALEPISQGEGLMLLLRNTPQVLADQPWILGPLERAVGEATCYMGHRGDARAAAAAILALASAAPRRDPRRWPLAAVRSTSSAPVEGP